jgi:hypothetical protein
MYIGSKGYFLGAHSYGGWTFHYGEIAKLTHEGVPFTHGCVGLSLPLVYLHNPENDVGLQLEFMLNDRPTAWLKPGTSPNIVNWCITWSTDRLLEPGQVHTYGGTAGLAPYTGQPISAMRHWRDTAADRYGLIPPKAPDWIRRANIIWFNMNPKSEKDFTRLDDPKCQELFKRWKDMGYTAIYGVAPNKIGPHICSPFDYIACEEVGGLDAEKQMLQWAHELGFHFFLWVTTVGINRDSPVAQKHPEWFTHRPNGDLFCAWNPPPPDYQNSMPDGDPLSKGFRKWLKDQVSYLIKRGYDGIYVDGCCPRASNHLRWAWPGEGRGAVEDQVRELATHVRTLGKDLITFVEDATPTMQASCEIIEGRYGPTNPYVVKTPYLKKFGWYHGVPGGTSQVDPDPPDLISPEMVKDYLLVRYASLLPNVLSEDILGGYDIPDSRPWIVQSIMAGMIPRTGSEYMHDSSEIEKMNSKNLSEADKDFVNRLKAHEEFLNLLRFCRDEYLIREAPLSIEGVNVEGDTAVIGILRPSPKRALLAVIQFANRPARVKVHLSKPIDIPIAFYNKAGRPEETKWAVKEIFRSISEEKSAPETYISNISSMVVDLSSYGFRIFELVPS